jgi:hypothetical protein
VTGESLLVCWSDVFWSSGEEWGCGLTRRHEEELTAEDAKENAKDAKKAVALLRQGKVNTKSKKKKVYWSAGLDIPACAEPVHLQAGLRRAGDSGYSILDV